MGEQDRNAKRHERHERHETKRDHACWPARRGPANAPHGRMSARAPPMDLPARTTTLDRWEQSTLERWSVLDTMDAMVVAVRCTRRAMCVTARRSHVVHLDTVATRPRVDETPEMRTGPADIVSAGPVLVAHLTTGGPCVSPACRAYEQVGAAVGLVSQYMRVPKLSGPCRAIAAARLSLFADVSVVE